ncbi:MAG: hypothetical protein C4521_12370 [Actinobacteria bacterium]|nr:MAG: hypothetical protein C4521_12370 [Actinomycetota bacterium]
MPVDDTKALEQAVEALAHSLTCPPDEKWHACRFERETYVYETYVYVFLVDRWPYCPRCWDAYLHRDE